MDKKVITESLKQAKANSPKRNFKQSVDLILNLKELDLKKPEHQINMFVTLHSPTGKKVSVCALVGPELGSKAKDIVDEVVLESDFANLKKADIKRLATQHDFFIGQATIMPKIATTFGKALGPRGKMPNPKLGSILPPTGNVQPLYEKLAKTVRLATTNELTVKCIIGKEDMSDDVLIDNVETVYKAVIDKLPNHENNVKTAMLKLTMGPSFVIGAKEDEKKNGKAPKAAPKAEEKPVEEKTEDTPKEEAKAEEKPVEAESEAAEEKKE